MILLLGKHSKKIAVFFLYFLSVNLTGDLKAAMLALHGGDLPYNKSNVVSTNVASYFQPDKPVFKREVQPLAISRPDHTSLKIDKEKSGVRFAPAGGGPTQPEMQSFKSANANNLVDLFTGDFSYNIPLMDVGGYPISMHYNSGISMDQEASWVGLGWNVNPGAVTRTMRGLPDDFNGNDSITKTLSIKDSKTVSVTGDVNIELFGNSNLVKVNLGASLGVVYNNYTGWGVETGISPSISTTLNSGKNSMPTLTGGLSITSSSMYGVNISPSLSYSLQGTEKPGFGASIGTNYNNRTGISALQLHAEVKQADINYKTMASEYDPIADVSRRVDVNNSANTHGASGFSSSISFATPSYMPSINLPFINNSYSFTGKVGFETWGLRPGFGITGSVSTQKLAYTTKNFAAYGYIYHTEAKKAEEALLDYNREKEIVFNYSTTPHIAIPSYTYDAFNISGEGIGGMFRAYRSDVGFVRDHKMQTKSATGNLSVDLGFGTYFHGGTDIMKVDVSTVNRAWMDKNALLSKIDYTESDSVYESVYFKSPGEQTVMDKNFIDAIGGDNLVRAKLVGDKENIGLGNQLEKFANARSISTVLVNDGIVKKQRDKRTQLITCLTAKEATMFGLDKTIKSYPENLYDTITRKANFQINLGNSCMTNIRTIKRQSEYRNPNHISEINVLNNDGKKYVYGLPVYNLEEREVSFNVTRETRPEYLDKGWTTYASEDDGVTNNKGKDSYFSENRTPAYAHSFLLTGILSADYVDIRNDGITDDDLGDAIKFNYTEVADSVNPFKWRIPYSKEANVANYNEGLRSYDRDDKASFIYGEKELWYLNSVESKNMVAIFSISKRYDQVGVNNRAGGLDTIAGRKLRRLDRIDLYSKADLIKNGTLAKPIKTVRFEYDSSLCKGIGGINWRGKLTLKKVWFSYNGGKERNPYVFNYFAENQAVYNPGYNPARYDRWGNYKDPSSNPGGLNNYDYPYTEQDSVKAAKNVSAWHLNSIQLPAGGKISVTYESDDYGFVQNKRATQFYSLAGFGNSPSATPVKELYNSGIADRMYVFVDLPVAVSNTAELKERYLKGIDTLFFKLFVAMPKNDKWVTSSPYEWIPVYTSIESFGLVSGSTTRAWIKVRDVNGGSPFAKVAIQFLRLNLPSKAYPNSETGSNVKIEDMIKALFASLGQYTTMFKSFESIAMKAGWAKETSLSQSFVRLDNPRIKKLGGGLRVKRVEMWDNWKAMTGGTMKEASYGKEYTYTTTEDINGKPALVSSGVASYEPGIGGDENPLRIAKELVEKTAVLAPANLMYSEEPLGESFFPSSMIGYSKVKVRTIHTKAKSANGWDETQFYTSRDFPVMTEYTPLDENGKKRFKPFLPSFFKFNAKDYVSITQGFKVELNDMNGKMKSQASYPENDPENPVNYTKYFYKVDDARAANQHLNNDVDVVSKTGIVENAIVGKEVELMVDFREQVSKTSSVNLGINVDVIPAFFFPIPIPSAIPFPQTEETRFRSSAIVKVISRHAILDSVVHVDKGSVVSTKNMVWDGESGEVVVSRTNNEFNDPVYNFSYPAYWAYEEMGPAYKNINASFANKGLKIIRGKLFGPNGEASYLEKYFRSGDEIYVYAQHAVNLNNILTPMARMSAPVIICNEPEWEAGGPRYNKIWAISADRGAEKHQGIYFIDQEGRPFNGKNFSIFTIIRSGNRNMPSAGAGSIVSLKSPLKVVTGVNRIQIDSSIQILNATSNTFKDLWKVNNHFYIKDTVYRTTFDTTITITPKRSLVLERVTYSDEMDNPILYRSYPSLNLFITAYVAKGWKRGIAKHNTNYDIKSIIDFDVENEVNKAVNTKNGFESSITNATLFLTGKNPSNAWPSDMYASPRNKTKGDHIEYPWHTNETPYTHYQRGDLKDRYNNSKIGNIRYTDWNNNTKYSESSPYSTSSLDMPAVGEIIQGNTSFPATQLVREAMDMKSYGFMLDIAVRTKPKAKDNYENTDRARSYWNEQSGQKPSLTISIHMKRDSAGQLCKLFITDSLINPYRFGILGNWRSDKTYAYYARRDQRIDAGLNGTVTDIRHDGTLAGFKPFWLFEEDRIKASEDSSQWSWTGVQSIFNRKGYELENHDALNRYNSGLYGYNQQLAIAAAQNARAREIFYDGMEDYDYDLNKCFILCKDPRTFDGFTIAGNESHTGKYALSLPANQLKNISFPLSDSQDQDGSLSIQVDSVANYITNVNPKGTGLTGSYTLNGIVQTRKDPVIDMDFSISPTPFGYWNGTPVMQFEWTGKIQVAATDYYTFFLERDLSSISRELKINNQIIRSSSRLESPRIFLVAGTLYPITITTAMRKRSVGFTAAPFGKIALNWQRDQMPVTTGVPMKNMYPADMIASDSSGSYESNIASYCVTLNNVKPRNIILPKVAPVKGSEIVVSAWVKMQGDNNNTMAANAISPLGIGYNTATSASIPLLPTGSRIEGWQRYEAVVTVPPTGSMLKLFFQTGTVPCFYDDIRIHPFSSNMKAFVYDPVSLKLVSDLDENNYAGFYEYDDEGTLIRVKKETERGIKTIKETQSALLKVIP